MSKSVKRKNSNDIIFTFDSLIDIEIGVVYAIIDDYLYDGDRTNQYINYPFLDLVAFDEEFPKMIRMRDIGENIVQQCFLGKARDEFLDIYLQYISNDYERIIKLAPKTDMVRLINQYARTGFIKSTVVCRNDLEVKYAKEFTNGKCIIKQVKQYTEVDLTGFARVVIANISDILQFRGLKLMHIAVLNYACNFTIELQNNKEVRMLLPQAVMPLWDINEFEVMNPYRIQEE